MPLTRANVTPIERVLLPAVSGLLVVIGLSWTIDPDAGLDASAALRYADDVLPLEMWGALALALAGVLTTGLLTHSRPLYKGGVAVAVVWLALWAVTLLVAAMSGQASWSAWAWPAFAAAVAFAVLVGVLAGGTSSTSSAAGAHSSGSA